MNEHTDMQVYRCASTRESEVRAMYSRLLSIP